MNRKSYNKPPKWGERVLGLLLSDDQYETPLGDFEEFFYHLTNDEGMFQAKMWYWRQIIRLLPAKLSNSIYWRMVMLKNYFKTTIRNLLKSRGFSFINVFGLATGLACCILIMLFVVDELSYDRYHENADRIYRMANRGVVNNNLDLTARSSPPLGEVLKNEFPEVEAVTRMRNYGYPVFRYMDHVFSEERVFWTDPAFFKVFSVQFIKGDAETALNRPDALVLTQSMATKYFGDEDPIGKTINTDNVRDLTVTAVVEDVPRNSHFHFDFLESIVGRRDVQSPVWYFNDYYTYVLLRENASSEDLEEKLFETVKQHVGPQIQGVLGISIDQFFESGGDFRYFLQKITDIHLRSHLDFELEPNGQIAYIYIFSSVALGILLIACINFVNLATARSSMRSREVGIRKAVGSTRRQLIRQFLSETIFMAMLAMIIALAIAQLLLPAFNQLAHKEMSLPFSSIEWLLAIIGFTFFIGFSAGVYPALFLSSFHPVDVLKGDVRSGGRKSILRSALVIFQFSISIILIMGTLVIRNQMSFIQNTNLGFSKDQVLVVHKTDDLGDQIQAFKNELLKHGQIISASNSSELMGNPFEIAAFIAEGTSGEETHLANYLGADADFLETYQIELQDGRFFDVDRRDGPVSVVLNESMVKSMGIENPVGKQLINGVNPQVKYPILGVVKDFHFESLHQRLRPLLFFTLQNREVGRYVSVRVRPQNLRETISHIDQTWRRFTGGQPFEYEFFDDRFARVFLAEERTGKLFFVFSVLAVVIASLGLFGLAAFITEQRTKEIGIRKVLGSSIIGILFLLFKEFAKWILIANVIAWPVAYMAMDRWLENFAYRTNIGIWIFISSTGLAVIIAVITVGYQTVKSSIANPVDSLRYE